MVKVKKFKIWYLVAVIIGISLLIAGSLISPSYRANTLHFAGNFQQPLKYSENVSVSNGVKIKYHYITEKEVYEMIKRFGIRNENKSYNQIINGHGTGLAPPTLKDWKRMIGKKVIDKVILNNKTLKSSVRWDLDSHFPPVGNQGQQGSCAAWAVSYYMNGFLQRKIHNWTDSYSWHLMSPAWTYNKVNGGSDKGSSPSDNAYIIKKVGDASLYTMPYDSSDYISWGDENAWREAPLYRIKDYQYIDLNDVNTIKYYLNQGYLIYFGINASTPGYNDGNFDGDHILSDYEYSGGIHNHAQTIVGYDDSISDDGEQGAFRVVNSGGTGWGDNGFYWITYKCISDKIAAGYPYGMYLIPMDEQPYTPKLLATWRFSDPGARDGGIDIFCDDDILQHRFVRFDGGSYPYPDFMALDISSLYDEWAKSGYKEKFKFLINDGSTSNTISSFKIEYYPYGYYSWYDPEGWADISTESPDVPKTIPAHDINVDDAISSGEFRPEIKIRIGEIKGLDPFDIGSDPDWYYYIGVSEDGGNTWHYRMSDYPIANDVNDLYVYKTMSFHVNTTNVMVAIELCDKDPLNDDLADISSDSGGGRDDYGHPIPFGIYYGVFWGESDMINNTWIWNDTLTTDEYGYWVTSGDYDGSTSTDENDAEVHFLIWDTYSLPVADAGNDKTVEINTYVNFSGSNSWSAVPDTRIVSYEWDFDGDGHYDAVGKNVSWKFTQLGTYTVTLKVTDNMGKSDTDTCTVKVVDTKPPTVTITTPNDGSSFNTHSITIKYQGSDTGSGIDHYEVKIDNGNYVNTGTSTSYTVSSLADGTHIVYVKAVDKAGNSAEDSVSFTVDTTNPSISITSPSDGAIFNKSSVTVEWSGSDSGSGIDHYEIQVDGGSWDNVGTSTSYTVSSLPDGTHTVYVKAVDKAGNSATSSINFTVDTTLPTLNIISPTNGTTLNSEKVILHWNASDLISGINHYEISVDNQKWINIGNDTTYTLKLTTGEHIVKIKAVDNAGNEIIKSIHLKISKTAGNPVWFWWIILFLLIAIFIIVIAIYMTKRRKRGDVNEP